MNKEYIEPEIKTTETAVELLAALSLHDKVGQEQLGNEASFDTEEQEDPRPQVNVWD